LQKMGDVPRIMLAVGIQGHDGAASVIQRQVESLPQGIPFSPVARKGNDLHVPASGDLFSPVRGPVVH